MGMLDTLFESQDPNTFRMGQLPHEDDPSGYAPPVYDDYSQGVPVRKKPEKVLDEDLKKFQETHPVTPQVAAAAAPAMPGAGQPMAGMLGPEMGGPYGAVPNAAAAPSYWSKQNFPEAPAERVPLPAPRPPEAPPRVAGAPMDTAIPSSAAPTSGQRGGSPAEGAVDMIDATPGMLSKVWSGIQNNSNLLMGLGAGMMGAPSWATGMGRGFAGAQAGAAADQKLNLQTGGAQQLYQALVQAGVPRQQAIAATTNPKLAETLMASYIGDRKREIKVLKDSLGNERLVSVNPYMDQGELDRANGESGARGAATTLESGSDTSGLARMPIELDPTTGRDEKFAEAFKKSDPVNYTATENMLNGNMAGTGRNLQQLMKYASRIDPAFNQVTYGARSNLYKSYYGGGEGYKGVRAANTAVQHGVDLDKDIEELHNFTVMPGFLNPVTGAVAKQFSERYQNALKNFKADKEVYSHELETALTGKSTVTGTKQLADLFDEDAPTGANKAALHTTLRDLNQRIEEHENAYNRGMGGKASSNPVHDFLTNRPKLERLFSGEKAPAAAPPLPAGWSVKVH